MEQKHSLFRRICPLFALCALLCTLYMAPTAAEGTVTAQLAVVGQSDSGFSFLSEPTAVEVDSENANVFAALQASGITYEEDDGYVTSIMGQAAAGWDGWQFTVNDSLVSVGAQQATLADGDVVLWVYTKGSNDYLMPTWESMTGSAPVNKTEPTALIGDGTGVTLEADGTLLSLSTAPDSINYASVGCGGSVLSQAYLTKDVPLIVKEYSLTNVTGTSTNLQITLTDDGIVAAPADPEEPVDFSTFLLQVDGVVFRLTTVTYMPPTEISVQFAIASQDDSGFSFVAQPSSLVVTKEQTWTVLGALIASGTEYEATDGYVTSVGGLAATGADGWQFHVNDTPISVGAQQATLKEGDTVLWVYSKASNGYIMPTWEAMTGETPANKQQPAALIGDGSSVTLSDSETKLTLDPTPSAITYACASASSEMLAQSWLTDGGDALSLKTYTLDNLSGEDTNLQITLKDDAFYLSPIDTTKAVDVKQFSLQVNGVNYRAVSISYQPVPAMPTPTPTPTPGSNASGSSGGSSRPSSSSNGGSSVVITAPETTPAPDTSAGGYPQPTPAVTEFSESDWFYAPTIALMEKNIIKGDADTGAVRPNDTIKREEIASLLVAAYQLPIVPHGDFVDSTSSDWALGLLYTLKENGIMNGDGTGMQGMQLASRLDVAVLLARMAGISSDDAVVLDSFSDATSIPDWARASVAAMVEYGYLSGYEDGTLRLEQPILRCETFALLYRMIAGVE